MSAVMASDTVSVCPEDTENLRTDEAVSPAKQSLEDVEDSLVTLSEKISLCKSVLSDLKDLSDVLVRKSLQDVSLPLQK